MVAIHLKSVTKQFKKLTAIKHLSLTINEGESVALLGSNGAGKTTLVEMIEGFEKPTQGKILIFNQSWSSFASKIKKQMGVCLQENHFSEQLTVLETLHLFARLYHIHPSKCEKLLQQFSLQEKKKTRIKTLSGGQKQRLALAIALIHNPKIIILDEPTTGLDPRARKNLWQLLLTLKKNRTLFLTTHYMQEAENLCKRILILHRGILLEDLALQTIYEKTKAYQIIEFKTNKKPNETTMKSIKGVVSYRWNDPQKQAHLEVKGLEGSVEQVLKIIKEHQIKLTDLEFRKKNLEDLFIELTGNKLNEEKEKLS